MKRMGEIIFDNPNKPEQPAKGVYRWFYVIAGREVTIYVGCAGNRKEYGGTPSTLKRGILEAQRSCLSSDCGRSLDTDFIVGSALLFLKNEGYDCHWQHISDLPEDERRLWLQHQPLLQPTNTNISSDFRIKKSSGDAPWEKHDRDIAQEHLFQCFAEFFNTKGAFLKPVG